MAAALPIGTDSGERRSLPGVGPGAEDVTLENVATEPSPTSNGTAPPTRKRGRPRRDAVGPPRPRQRARRTTDEQRRLIIECVDEKAMSLSEVASCLGMKRNTVSSVIHRYRQDGIINRSAVVRKQHTSRFTFEMHRFICACFLRCAKPSAKAVAWMYTFNYGEPISLSTVRHIRITGGITLKLLRQRKEAWNTVTSMQERADFARWWLPNTTSYRFIYIGEQTYNSCDTIRWPGAISLHMAVSPQHRVLHSAVLPKATDHVTTAEFLQGVLDKLAELDKQRDIEGDADADRRRWMLVLDHDKHHRHRDVTKLLDGSGVMYKYLPSNSPFLNPINACFGAIADDLVTSDTVVPLAALATKAMTAVQLAKLKKDIGGAVSIAVTAEHVRAFEQRCLELLPACSAGVPICDPSHPPSQATVDEMARRLATLKERSEATGTPLDKLLATAFPPKGDDARALSRRVDDACLAWTDRAKNTPAAQSYWAGERVGSPDWCCIVDAEALRAYVAEHPSSERAKLFLHIRTLDPGYRLDFSVRLAAAEILDDPNDPRRATVETNAAVGDVSPTPGCGSGSG